MKEAALEFESRGLVGRDNEVQTLVSVFATSGALVDQDDSRRSQGGPELVLVHGCSGSGKSAVISQAVATYLDEEEEEGLTLVHRRSNCLVGYGKFGQYEGDELPYSGIVDAIQDIFRVVLQQYIEETKEMKEELQKALDGSQLQHLIDVVPLLASIFDSASQNEKTSLDQFWADNQESTDEFSLHQLEFSFQTFVRVMLRTASIRLVLVVEDMQWADAGSLELMEALAVDTDIIGLTIVGSYRDNEVDESHPLHKWLVSIASWKVPEHLTWIPVSNLKLDDLNEFIAKTLELHRNGETMALSRAIYRQTNGNPFYAREMLRRLVRDKAIFYSMNDFRWNFDIDKVESCAEVLDNVVDLVVQKIQNLPTDTIRALQIASYLGSHFDASVIDSILLGSTDHSHGQVQQHMKCSKRQQEQSRRGAAALKEAIEEELLAKREDKDRFRFVHDKIQQAAFSMLAKDDKDSRLLHLQIGQHLKRRYDDGDMSSLLPAVVQLNQGSSLMQDITERIKLANLNYRAAKLLKKRSALTSTVSFLQLGLALIPQESLWGEFYNLTLPMQALRCDVLCSLGDHTESNRIIDEIFANARCREDTFEPSLTRMQSLLYQDRLSESIDAGVRLLKVLGVNIPRKPGLSSVIWEFVKSKNALKGKSGDDILHHVEIADRQKYFAKKVIQITSLATSFCDENNLGAVLNFRAVQITLKHGISKYSAVGFAGYGLSLGMNGAFQDAFVWGTVAQDLLHRFKSKRSNSYAQTVIHVFLNHIGRPLQESLDPLLVAYNDGMNTGDIQSAGLACTTYCAIYLLCGLPLDAVAKDFKKYSTTMTRYRSQFSVKLINIWGQMVSNLRGHDPTSRENPVKLTGVFMNEEVAIPKLNRLQMVTLHLAKLIAAFLLGYLELSLEAIECDRKLTSESTDGTLFFIPAKCFFSALTASLLEQRQRSSKKERYKRKYYRQLRRSYVSRLEKWYANGVMSIHHFVMILRAEVALTERKGTLDDIKAAYEKAITASARSGCVYAHGIALERMGVFFRDAMGDFDSASYFLRQAYERFGDWQSEAKLEQMRRAYSDLLLDEGNDDEDNAMIAYQDEVGLSFSAANTSRENTSATTSSSHSCPRHHRHQKFMAASHSIRRVSLTRPTTGVVRVTVRGRERYDSTATDKHFAKADEVAERWSCSSDASDESSHLSEISHCE